MTKKVCPYCGSINISVEGDYKNFSKKIENELVKNEFDPLFQKALLEIKNYNPYDDDEYLIDLEKNGFYCYCRDCGNEFLENEESKKEKLTKISEELFFEIILAAYREVLPDRINSIEGIDYVKSIYKSVINVYYEEIAIAAAKNIMGNHAL